jgi:hypothetical protein
VFDLGVGKDSDKFAFVSQTDSLAVLESFFVFIVYREYNWNGLVDRFLSTQKDTKMLTLKKLSLTHESLQWGRPTFG